MGNTKQWLALLHHQYSQLENKIDLDLLLKLRRFIQFLDSDSQSIRYITEMERNWETRYKRWFDVCGEVQHELSVLESKIRRTGGEIQKFLECGNEIKNEAGFESARHILDKISEPDWYQDWNNLTDDLNLELLHFEEPGQTLTGHMVAHVYGITNTLVRLTKALEIECQAADELNKEAEILRRKYDSAQWKVKNDWMSSGTCAIKQLRIVIKIVDREIFVDLSILEFPDVRPLLPWACLLAMYAPPDLKDKAEYWQNDPKANKDFEKEIQPLIKSYLRNLVEELQFIANTRLSHQHLIGQYKTRCENYEWKEIVDTIEAYTKEIKRKSKDKGTRPRYEYEDVLTLHLARYLYDNGYSVHYTPRDGVHEPDLLGKMSNELEPIVVEAKVVGQKNGKQQGVPWIYNGLRALLAYLEKYHNDYGVTDGYLIVFRIGDKTTTTYTFDPSEWVIGQFTIIPVIINIGQINKEDPPVIITQEEFLRQYNNLSTN